MHTYTHTYKDIYTHTFIRHGFSLFQDWKSVQHLFIKSGSDSLKQRVNTFDLKNIDISVAVDAENLFRSYKRPEVERISTGIAIFYDWVSFLSSSFEYPTHTPMLGIVCMRT